MENEEREEGEMEQRKDCQRFMIELEDDLTEEQLTFLQDAFKEYPGVGKVFFMNYGVYEIYIEATTIPNPSPN